MENDFEKLVEDVIKNPELLLNPDLISNDQLIELQKKLNPYVNLTTNSDERQVAVCSYTNLREDYIRRFTMTSLVTFLFQVLHEYEIPKEKLVWIPEEQKQEPFSIKEIKDKLDALYVVVNEAEMTEQEEQRLKRKLAMKELLEEDKSDTLCNDISKELYNMDEKKNGLLFTITHMLKELGISADNKLSKTTELASKFPGIRSLIKNSKKNFSENIFPEIKAKEIINEFLTNWLSFDASYHIREGHNLDKIKTEVKKAVDGQNITIDPEDPGHITVDSLRAKITPTKEDMFYLEPLFKNHRACNAAIHIIREESLHDSIKYMLSSDEKINHFKQYLLPLQKLRLDAMPPQDTFHRWNYFTEVNYEELRTITECLYPERPDLDWAIAIWTTFKGSDEEVEKQFTEYCQQHQDELPSSIRSLEMGKWTILGDFKENRKNIQFYNKNTEVLKRIIDRHTEDKKIGTELMRNRVRHVKAKNIEEEGPDAPGLKNYKATVNSDGKDLSSKGVEKVISPEEMKRLEKTRGNLKAAKELEVLEEYEKIIQGLDEIKKYRPLSKEEIDKYEKAESVIKQAKEMLNVPDDAIQVDIFTSNAKTGDFKKSHFYTKCEEALDSSSSNNTK